MIFPNGQIVTILRDSPAGIDPVTGDPFTTTTARIDVAGCALAPRMSTEPTVLGRNGVIVGQTLFLPAGTDIRFTDRIELHGGGTVAGAPVTPATAVVYVVDGEAGEWTNPFTGTSFPTEVAIRRAVG